MTKSTVTRRDRYADWAVVAVVAIALVLGLVLREVTLSRTTPFDLEEAGVAGRCPAAWVRETGDDPLLRASDPRGGAFDPTLEVRSRPLAADADPILVLDALTLERAGRTDAYETLDTSQVLAGSEAATSRAFAYVYVDRNPYVDRLPVVVQGQDVALRDGTGRVVIVTLLAGAEDFDANLRHLSALVESLEF
jgi:hypothetical protein